MRFFSYLSNLMIPFLMLYVVGYGLLAKRDVYQDFLEGARDGILTVWKIMPTLIGLITGVGVLRASGFLDFLAELIGRATQWIGFPSELVPLTLVRLFSSSAAAGLLLDIFKTFGTDSFVGIAGALILSATESVLYCMSVYFGAVKIEKTRYTLTGALLANLAGVAAAVFFAGFVTPGG